MRATWAIIGIWMTLWTGTAAAAGPYLFVKIVDTSTPIPGGSGTYTSFGAPVSTFTPALGAVAPTIFFGAEGAGGLQGIYRGGMMFPFSASPLQPVTRLVDTNTPLPEGGGSFTAFEGPSVNRHVAFLAAGSANPSVRSIYSIGESGITRIARPGDPRGDGAPLATLSAPGAGEGFTVFATTASDPDLEFPALVRHSGGVNSVIDTGPTFGVPVVAHPFTQPPDPPTIAYKATGEANFQAIKAQRGPAVRQVSTNSDIPGGAGKFTGFGDPAVDRDGNVYFRGFGAGGQEGIYSISTLPGLPTARATVGGAVPGRPGVTITGFSDPANGAVVASLSDGGEILYSLGFGGGEYISTGEILDGKVISDLEISRQAIGGATNFWVGFKANFTDGSQGLYVATIPEPGSSAALFVGAGVCLARRRRAPARPFRAFHLRP